MIFYSISHDRTSNKYKKASEIGLKNKDVYSFGHLNSTERNVFPHETTQHAFYQILVFEISI